MWASVKRFLFPQCQFEVIATTEQLKRISRMKRVHVSVVSGSTRQHQREKVLRITCAPTLVEDVINCVQIPQHPQQQQHLQKGMEPVCAPEMPPNAQSPQETERVGGAPVAQSPSSAGKSIEMESEISLGTWDGKVTLHFTWNPAPDPFSEFCDPLGSNWHSGSSVRRAITEAPKKIVLQYRQGMSAAWINVPCDELGKAQVVIEPSAAEAKAFRGFQSRWLVDGELFLTPLERAPTLSSKIMSVAKIRELVKNLPKDQQQKIECIPNEEVKKVLTAVENYLPMNTWDYSFGVRSKPGVVVNGVAELTTAESIQLTAEAKMNDPQIRAAWRSTVLKSPLTMMNGLLGSIGLSLEAVVSNLDVFIPNAAEPDFDELQKSEEAESGGGGGDVNRSEETRRRDMQREVNKLFPSYLNGLRVVIPGLESLRRASIAKRPALQNAALPVVARCLLSAGVARDMQFVWWRGEGGAKTSIRCVALELEDSGSDAPGSKMVRYIAEFPADPGQYRYYWLADGAPFSSRGRQYGSEDGSSYEEFVVESRITFGVGIAV